MGATEIRLEFWMTFLIMARLLRENYPNLQIFIKI